MQDCQDAGKKQLKLIWVDTDKSVDHAHKKIRSRLCAREHKTEPGMIPRSLLASQLFSLIPPLEAVKALVSIMMSVNWSSKGKPLNLRHYDITRAHLQGTAQRLTYILLTTEDRPKYDEDKVGRLTKSMYGNSRCFSHLATRLRDPDLWRFGTIPNRQTQCHIVPQSK